MPVPTAEQKARILVWADDIEHRALAVEAEAERALEKAIELADSRGKEKLEAAAMKARRAVQLMTEARERLGKVK